MVTRGLYPWMKIQDDHFTLTEHEHICTTNLKCYICFIQPTEATWYSYKHEYTIVRVHDISNLVVDYSYSCSKGDNIRQSAEVTFKTEPEGYYLYGREEQDTVWVNDNGSRQGVFTGYFNCIELIKTYTYPNTGQTFEMHLGYFIVTNVDHEYASENASMKISLSGLSILLTPEYGGNIHQNYESTNIEKTKLVKDANGKIVERTETVEYRAKPAYTIAYGTWLDSGLFHGIATTDSTTAIPIQPYVWVESAGQTYAYVLEADGMKFAPDASKHDIITQLLEKNYIDGEYWIDEERFMHIAGRPFNRTSPVALYKDYGDLVISESRSVEGADRYTATEVYGSDGVYAEYEDLLRAYSSTTGPFYRLNAVGDEYVQDNTEAYERAKLETYHSQWEHETVTVVLHDRYISWFSTPSNKVGKCIEYRAMDGHTSVFTLNSIEMSNDNIQLTLVPFRPYFSEEENFMENTLETPYITSHEILGDNHNIIRLYVDTLETDNVDYGIARVMRGNGQGNWESCLHDEQGRLYVDIPITANGDYSYYVQLYSPYWETSGWGGEAATQHEMSPYTVSVRDYVSPVVEYNDPYPHPPMDIDEGGHPPYITSKKNNGKNIATETNTIITT